MTTGSTRGIVTCSSVLAYGSVMFGLWWYCEDYMYKYAAELQPLKWGFNAWNNGLMLGGKFLNPRGAGWKILGCWDEMKTARLMHLRAITCKTTASRNQRRSSVGLYFSTQYHTGNSYKYHNLFQTSNSCKMLQERNKKTLSVLSYIYIAPKTACCQTASCIFIN